MLKGVISVLFMSIAGFAYSQNPTIKSFYTEKLDNHIIVHWITHAGFSCEDIKLYFGEDSTNFERIYLYPGICGGPAEEESYFFIHEDPNTEGENYYYLDLGTYGVSETISAVYENPDPNGYVLYPNPVDKNSTIFVDNSIQSDLKIRVFSTTGQLQFDHEVGIVNEVKFSDLPELKTGIYSFEIYSDSGRSIRGKFVIP